MVGFGVVLTGVAHAQPAPAIAENDTWTYQNTVEVGTNWRQTREELTVDHAGSGSIAITDKTVGSSGPPHQIVVNSDWSRARSVDGHQTTVNQPMDFPLRPGKTWTIEYTETNPNREHTSEHYRSPYKVLGWEMVTVPAGTFRAMKIECEGEWSAAIAPAVTAGSVARVDGRGATTVVQTNRIQPTTVSGRTYKAFWYVPEVKRWVKSVEEYYSSGGSRTSSYKDELLSYKTGG